VIIGSYPDADANALRALADDLRGMTGRFVLVAAGVAGDRPSLLVAASRDLAAEGFDAGQVVRQAAPIIGGGGGGRPDLAQAGGRNAARLDEALREAGRLALEALQRIETPSGSSGGASPIDFDPPVAAARRRPSPRWTSAPSTPRRWSSAWSATTTARWPAPCAAAGGSARAWRTCSRGR